MENEPLISVIVPVYKVERYLDRCVESIVNQTYRNLEIILVDDGSPDGCPAMCDAWAERDERIRVIHKENGGGGSARNAGLVQAAGEYIAFVDSDDYISPGMYEGLLSLMDRETDIVECGFVEAYDDRAALDMGLCTGEGAAYTALQAMREHVRDRIFRQLIWNKLYRRSVTEGIRFPEEKGIDDEFWTYRAIARARKLLRTEEKLYAYRQQEDSVMHRLRTGQMLSALRAKTERHDYLCAEMPELTAESLLSLWLGCLYVGQRAEREHSAEREAVLSQLESILRNYPADRTLRKQYRWKDRLWLSAGGVSFRLTCRIRNAMRIGL